MGRKLNLAVVGLRFGGAFPPIYLAHPEVARVAICDRDPAVLAAYGDRFGIRERFTDVKALLADPAWDAVHLVTGIPNHAELTLAAMAAGKHCACTVPMATRLEDLAAIVALSKKSGLRYMMMETAVYTTQYLHARAMHARGEFGRVQFLRGAHYQDMEHWPAYWLGLPPMWYATHALSPLLALQGVWAQRVCCFGSGAMRPELQKIYGNPFPIETALFRLSNGLAAEATRSLFQTAHAYLESFHVLGEKKSFEWHVENESPIITTMEPNEASQRGNRVATEPVQAEDRKDLLPLELRPFTEAHVVPDPQSPHQSIKQGGGHHGSHPHLAHEFVRSVVEGRPSAIDAVTAAHWTAAGICAHASAMQDGKEVAVPDFS
ncbi:MAG: Gfo/Idh/MocA family oxidoreductase [Spirochaetes bacterium]|nr:Gfo/Idh/MocA family oxidoreductase [Spirochaetota bacterium]